MQLIYKLKVKASSRSKITKLQDAFAVLKNNWNYETIECVTLQLHIIKARL
jgi:hypothetical protein